jgi:hypothetical protein
VLDSTLEFAGEEGTGGSGMCMFLGLWKALDEAVVV